jgi:hypothetical protein
MSIKHRYSDFIVNEIDVNGKIAVLTKNLKDEEEDK